MRKTLFSGIVVGIILGTGVVFGGIVPEQVDAEAAWVVHFDMDGFRGSQLGTYLSSVITSGEMNSKLQSMKDKFGFDPWSDLTAFTAYGSDAKPTNGVFIVRGVFDAEAIVGVMREMEAFSTMEYAGHTLYRTLRPVRCHRSRRNGGNRMVYSWCAFYGDNTVVGGRNPERVKSALDVLDGRRSSIQSLSSGFLSDVGNIDGFFFACADLAGMDVDPRASVLKASSFMEMQVCETAGKIRAVLRLDVGDREKAEQIRMMMEGMLAAGKLNSERRPLAATIAESCVVTRDDKTLVCTMECPVDTVTGIVDEKLNSRKAEEE